MTTSLEFLARHRSRSRNAIRIFASGYWNDNLGKSLVKALQIQCDEVSAGRLTCLKFSLKLGLCFPTVHSPAANVGGQTSFHFNNYLEHY